MHTVAYNDIYTVTHLRIDQQPWIPLMIENSDSTLVMKFGQGIKV